MIDEEEAGEAFNRTVRYWRGWLAKSAYRGRWREMVHRSALTLKLLTYRPTGAIVAAPTTSLPEGIGGARNWDYRYTWIRDAAFTLYGLLRLGFTEEAGAFMGWLSDRYRESAGRGDGPLQIMYCVDGRPDLEELELDHLEGYRGSGPVRVGNGAATQLQLDIYGELIDSVYLYNKYGQPISYDDWSALVGIVDWICDNWDRPDEGIWEVRGGRQHFTYSRMMCWVAIERAIRMARQRGLPADLNRWRDQRDAITQQIMDRGWHPQRNAFVQHYDTDVLDASVLLMPLIKFIAPRDPRWLSTLDAIGEELVSDSLVYRYNSGGIAGRARGRGGHVLDLHVLVRGGDGPGRAPGRGPPGLREDADLRQPPRPLLRGDRPLRRGARQLPAGVHPPGPDLRRRQPRLPAGVGRLQTVVSRCRRSRPVPSTVPSLLLARLGFRRLCVST